MDRELKIYAIRDKSTGKFIKDLVRPNHKFWEKRGFAENALKNFLWKCENDYPRPKYNPDNLEVVELKKCEILQKKNRQLIIKLSKKCQLRF